MKRWEVLETLLLTHNIKPTSAPFMNDWVAIELGTDWQEAHLIIQAYLTAQRGKRSKTLYVLKRMPGTRTSQARWKIGQRTSDVTVVTRAFVDDFKCRFRRAIEPDLNRLAEINPRAAQKARKMIDSCIDDVIPMMEKALNK